MATFTKNELILDRVRSLSVQDPSTGKLSYRLTSLEDPSLQCTAEGEEVTDAIGSIITTLYRAKKATFSATNSLISLDLAAAQFGSKKVVADSTNKITDYTCEIITAAKGATEVTLKNIPVNDIKYIYSIANNEIGTSFQAAATASATEFVIDAENKKITLPTDFTKDAAQKIYVEYQYETEKAVSVTNKASEFPTTSSVIVYAYFRDKCDDNLVYSGKIIFHKAKLNPEQVELALTSTGKHAFEFTVQKDYCSEDDDELFTIIVAE